MSQRLAALALLLVGAAAWAQKPPEAIPADPLQIVGPPAGRVVTGPELDRFAQQTAALLRCPVCQGLSVNDSPSPLALKMKAQVRELRAQGYTEEQVLVYFEKSYGEFVRLSPQLVGINWLVWLAPVGALLLGGFVVLRVLGRRPASQAEAPAAALEPQDPALKAYIERARELARDEEPKRR